MATASERGIPIKDETTFWWVWSAHGATDNGLYYGRVFIKGMVPLPLPGDVATELEYRGYYLTAYVDGDVFSHWEKDENHAFHQHPVFEQIEAGEPFPPSVLPDNLPDSWVEFFSRYTASGRLKKEYRGS